jgi:hypothetical protein
MALEKRKHLVVVLLVHPGQLAPLGPVAVVLHVLGAQVQPLIEILFEALLDVPVGQLLQEHRRQSDGEQGFPGRRDVLEHPYQRDVGVGHDLE